MQRIPAMTKAAVAQHTESFRQLCHARGIPFTTQRRVVLQAVLELGSHPTADEVYAAPAVRAAAVSRATVYRTLENLVRLGAIVKIGHPGAAVRYDGRPELHHHLVCLQCNAITDFASPQLDAVQVPDAGKLGFWAKDLHVYISGLCRKCLTDTTNPP